ncbi:MAG TPA: putative toxin-antitoxin system toxin component, PIN family [Candidatus Altiarchaeales archaeon]|nr:putative toxin-antitoxin system toxin component, PIN family [Candidatus Altiarchaeales archaeon]
MVTVVVDTNLFIAGRFNTQSSSNKILDWVVEGTVSAVYSPQIKDENLFILQKVNPPRDFVDKIFKYYNCPHNTLVRPKKRTSACQDKSDNRYLEAAVEGGADYVISNDHHLLDIGEYCGVKILRPGEFTRKIQRKVVVE